MWEETFLTKDDIFLDICLVGLKTLQNTSESSVSWKRLQSGTFENETTLLFDT